MLLVPVWCKGQHFEIGVDGGFVFHSLPMDNTIAKQDKASLGYTTGVSIDLQLPHSQIGIGASFTQITETNYLAPNYTFKIRNYVANPLTSPYAFYNYLWDYGHVYSYAGGMAGLAVGRVGVNSYNNSGGNISSYSTTYYSTFGYVAGLQAGFVFRVTKKIGVGGEAALRYANYTYTPPNNPGENPYKYRYFYFPFTAALKYFF